MGFDGRGYLRLGGIRFGDSSAIALNFRTSEPDGVLLYESTSVAVGRKARKGRNVTRRNASAKKVLLLQLI